MSLELALMLFRAPRFSRLQPQRSLLSCRQARLHRHTHTFRCENPILLPQRFGLLACYILHQPSYIIHLIATCVLHLLSKVDHENRPRLSLSEAFDAVYNSRLFLKLNNPKTGLYFQSSGYVYSYLESELKLESA